MNLKDLFDTLEVPEPSKGKVFAAAPIPEHSAFRLAIDENANPVLLLSVANPLKSRAIKNFRLKHLQLAHNVECKISENGKSSRQNFTVITFTNPDRHLQEYFLRVSETLVKSLKAKPTQEDVVRTLNHFIEIFRALADTPSKTVQGLWSELFLIDNASNPNNVLNYWHNIPEEKFDFNSGKEKIEIKSSGNFERIHTFSSEQLNPPVGTSVLIASVFIRASNTGKSIQDLVDSISAKIQNDIELIDKLHTIVIRTLGNTFEHSIRIKFDYQIARDSFRLYRHTDIKKIDRICIPDEVTEVRYKSDLTSAKPVDVNEIEEKGELYRSI